MTLDDLRGTDGLAYVATPYSLHPHGLSSAAYDAARYTEHLIYHYDIQAFSPIVHGHQLSRLDRLQPRDHELWMRLNRPLMEAASVMILVKMPGWQESRGMAEEAAFFQAAGKPIVEMEPLD